MSPLPDDGDMDARVTLHLADERPVRLARVHLRARPAVDGQRLYAAVLQLLCQFRDDQLLEVPSQSRLHRHGQFHGVHHLARNLQHLGYVLQHACARPFARHLLHRTAEVQVDDVGPRLLHDPCRFHHRLHVAPVDLYAHWALHVADGQFRDG